MIGKEAVFSGHSADVTEKALQPDAVYSTYMFNPSDSLSTEEELCDIHVGIDETVIFSVFSHRRLSTTLTRQQDLKVKFF